MKIVLASSSPFRKELLQRLGLAFDCMSPDIDESPISNESPVELVQRLAQSKAQVAQRQDNSCIYIGCDTLACLEGSVLGKPLNLDNAMVQLMSMRNKTVDFITGLCVLSPNHPPQIDVSHSYAAFKDFSEEQAMAYCLKEEPFYSCGSFKSETSAVSLLKSLKSDDPTSIVGLPMIKLCQMLDNIGKQTF